MVAKGLLFLCSSLLLVSCYSSLANVVVVQTKPAVKVEPVVTARSLGGGSWNNDNSDDYGNSGWNNDDNDNGSNNNDNDNDYGNKNKGGKSNNYNGDDDNGSYGGSGSGRVVSAYGNNNNDDNNNDYGNSKNQKGGSVNAAQVIPQSLQRLQTLDDVYTQNDAQILYRLEFCSNFSEWNPRSNASNWKFDAGEFGGNRPADNALIQNYCDDYGQNNPYGSKSLFEGDRNTGGGYSKLYSLPFTGNRYTEGFLNYDESFNVSNSQRILLRAKFACQTIDNDKHPFPRSQVSKYNDDLRLGNCAIFVANNNDDSKPLLYVAVTNSAVWAVYSETTFNAKRRIGIRPRYDSVVDAGIEVDARQGIAHFYLNGYRVWTINSLGVPPPNDGLTNIDYGRIEQATLATVSSIRISFGTEKCLDESDPNNIANTARLVRIRDLDNPYYANNSVFYDAESLRTNKVWGQGAIMTLYNLVVLRIESRIAAQPAPLPGVYGSQASKSLSSGGNDNNNNDNGYSSGNGGGSGGSDYSSINEQW